MSCRTTTSPCRRSSITDERKEVVDFTEPYYKSDQGILAETGTTVATLDDAKKLQCGVQTGTTGEYFVTDIVKPEQQPQVFQDLDGGLHRARRRARSTP